MNKFRLMLCILTVILLFCGSVYSQPIPGSYDSREPYKDFEAGVWQEFLYGGAEGAPGNEITAGALPYYLFEGSKLDSVVLLGEPGPTRNYYEYRTVYKGGKLTLFRQAGWNNPGDDAYVVNLQNTIVITKKYVGEDGKLTNFIEFALIVVDAEFADYPGYTASVTAKYLGRPEIKTEPLRFGDSLTWAIISIQGPQIVNVPVDIKPGSCPNPVNVTSKGVLPVAILGTADFDVSQINLSSIKLNGVSPLRSSLEDVAAPFEPFVGKTGAYACNRKGADDYMDLGLKFDTQAFAKSLGAVSNREAMVVGLTGELLDGTRIQGEDVITIIKNK